MTPILSHEGRIALAGFLHHDTLLAFDYDGTLAPIVADPARACMRQRTCDLLLAVARHRPTIILSGRARSDALRFVTGIPVLDVIGNHGSETQVTSPDSSGQKIELWHRHLEEQLRDCPGIRIEDKRHSLSIHYRACSDPVAAARRIREVCRALSGVRVIGGKSVINLLPREAPDKGLALLQALDRLGCPRALFVGDDETDEDVFRLRQPQRVLSVRVRRSDQSAAEYFLESQDQIDELLTVLAGMPTGGGEEGRSP